MWTWLVRVQPAPQQEGGGGAGWQLWCSRRALCPVCPRRSVRAAEAARICLGVSDRRYRFRANLVCGVSAYLTGSVPLQYEYSDTKWGKSFHCFTFSASRRQNVWHHRLWGAMGFAKYLHLLEFMQCKKQPVTEASGLQPFLVKWWQSTGEVSCEHFLRSDACVLSPAPAAGREAARNLTWFLPTTKSAQESGCFGDGGMYMPKFWSGFD